MTKQDFIAGKKFEYTGHFGLLSTQVSVHYNDTFLHDQFGERFSFVMGEPNEFCFTTWKAGYGSRVVWFKDCKLKGEPVYD